MKKGFKYLVMILLAISFTSCGDEFKEVDNNKPNDEDNKISFSVKEESAFGAKGTVLTNANFTKFNVFGYSSVAAFSDNTPMNPYIDNLKVTKSGNNWNYAGQDYYWPETENLHFFRVATDGTSIGLPTGITNWTIPNGQGYPKFSFQMQNSIANVKDLVIAKAVNKTKTNTTGAVNLEFKHILSKFSFNITNNTYRWITPSKIRISKISILNTIQKADYIFDSNKGSWTNPNGRIGEIDYWTGRRAFNYDESSDFSENLFIIPGSDIQVRIYFQVSLLGVTWSGDKFSTFSLTNLSVGSNNRFNITIEGRYE